MYVGTSNLCGMTSQKIISKEVTFKLRPGGWGEGRELVKGSVV